ncbi:MAG: hypothetical protein ACNA8R_02540 [Nitriliruptoraceae bacterium]
MGRRFITARDVDDVVIEGRTELRIGAGDRLTDLARERARDRGIVIVEAGATSVGPVASAAARPGAAGAPAAAPARAPDPAPSRPPEPPARPASSTPRDADSVPRRQLRAAVRAGVVEEFGGAPEGLDAAIGRVFDRLGIGDD